jgi:hypothetical protein
VGLAKITAEVAKSRPHDDDPRPEDIFYYACHTVRMGDPLELEAAGGWVGQARGIMNLGVLDVLIPPEMIAVAPPRP